MGAEGEKVCERIERAKQCRTGVVNYKRKKLCRNSRIKRWTRLRYHISKVVCA